VIQWRSAEVKRLRTAGLDIAIHTIFQDLETSDHYESLFKLVKI
jgi:hypothetical protein